MKSLVKSVETILLEIVQFVDEKGFIMDDENLMENGQNPTKIVNKIMKSLHAQVNKSLESLSIFRTINDNDKDYVHCHCLAILFFLGNNYDEKSDGENNKGEDKLPQILLKTILNEIKQIVSYM